MNQADDGITACRGTIPQPPAEPLGTVTRCPICGEQGVLMQAAPTCDGAIATTVVVWHKAVITLGESSLPAKRD